MNSRRARDWRLRGDYGAGDAITGENAHGKDRRQLGNYMRKLGIQEDTILLPAGRYLQTERNLRRNRRVQLLVASRKVRGPAAGPGVPHHRHRRDTRVG